MVQPGEDETTPRRAEHQDKRRKYDISFAAVRVETPFAPNGAASPCRLQRATDEIETRGNRQEDERLEFHVLVPRLPTFPTAPRDPAGRETNATVRGKPK